jgi:lipopolysaccharide biosynthesis glycosyltransferase
MNTSLVTLLNEDFVIGFNVLLNSLLRHNPWFNHPIIILDDGLTNPTKEKLLSRYDKILFQDIEKKNYKDFNFSVTAPKLRSTYYKLDAFNIKGFDRIVFIDSDCLILGNIESLFAQTEQFCAVKGYDPGTDILRRDINSGVFVANEECLTEEVYQELLRVARSGHKMPDQATLNIYFKNRITFLDKTFNVEKRMLYTTKFKQALTNAKILHYVGEKPWQKKTTVREEQYKSLERKWFEYTK